LPIRGSWEPTREEGAFNVRPESEWMPPESMARCFAGVWDYYTEWKHPETGQGPLFVIDEAQNVIPFKQTSQAVEEWVALHRHWTCDVLYLTQSYGKLSAAIRDNVQMVYRCRKMVAWGKPDKYIRKVQDGLRGEVMNEGERKYEKRYFALYKSHTQGGSGNEANADDVRPWWKHWSFMGAVACALFVVAMFAFGPAKVNPISNGLRKDAQVKPVKVSEVTTINGKVVDSKTSEKPEEKKPEEPQDHPYIGRALHVIGSWKIAAKTKVLFAISQNGQYVSEVTSEDMQKLGYKLETTTPCAVKVSYGGWSKWIICDAPQIAVVPAAGVETGGAQNVARATGKPSAVPPMPQGIENGKSV